MVVLLLLVLLVLVLVLLLLLLLQRVEWRVERSVGNETPAAPIAAHPGCSATGSVDICYVKQVLYSLRGTVFNRGGKQRLRLKVAVGRR